MRPKRRVVLVDSDSPNWREAIDRSPGFACYVSPQTLKQPRFWDHLDYARHQQKPVLACVEMGTILPAGFFAGIPRCLVVEVASPEEVAQWTILFMNTYLAEGTDA